MGLFGELDAHEVNDNPFFVDKGDYLSVLTDFTLRPKNDGEGVGLSMNWTIEEEGDFEGNTLSEWINVYPEITSDDLTRDIKRDQARLKQRLTQMGFTPSEMNELMDSDGTFNEDLAADKLGLNAVVTVAVNSDRNNPDVKYSNIRKVKLLDAD